MENFEQLHQNILGEYEKDFEQALRFIEQGEEKYPEDQAEILFWKAALYCRLGRSKDAIKLFKEGIKKGIWWPSEVLSSNSDFKSIQGTEDFLWILEQCNDKQKEAQKHAKLNWNVWNSRDVMNTPLVLSLHWRGDNIENFSSYWDAPKLRDKFTFAFLQSSQVLAPDAYCWDDKAKAKQEVLTASEKITAPEDINSDEIILSGASQGGKLAIEMILEENAIPAKGFVAMIPAIREEEQYTSIIEKAAERGVRGCIITGDQDPYYSGVNVFCSALKKHNFPCKLMVSHGIGHFFPDDFHDRFLKATDYIFGK